MSGNELSLNVMNLADTIRDRVRQTIVATIPDEQVDKLVKNEWDTFFQAPASTGYDREVKRSPFQNMVKDELDKLLKEKIRLRVTAELDKFNSLTWENAAKDYMSKFIAEYTPHALEGLAKTMVISSLQNMRNNGVI